MAAELCFALARPSQGNLQWMVLSLRGKETFPELLGQDVKLASDVVGESAKAFGRA